MRCGRGSRQSPDGLSSLLTINGSDQIVKGEERGEREMVAVDKARHARVGQHLARMAGTPAQDRAIGAVLKGYYARAIPRYRRKHTRRRERDARTPTLRHPTGRPVFRPQPLE